MTRRNNVIISTTVQGYDDSSCTDNTDFHTPNLDWLAEVWQAFWIGKQAPGMFAVTYIAAYQTITPAMQMQVHTPFYTAYGVYPTDW